MHTVTYTLTTKSQVTLPKPIREHLKIGPGEAVEFRIVADGGVRVQPVAAVPSKAPRSLIDKFKKLQGTVGALLAAWRVAWRVASIRWCLPSGALTSARWMRRKQRSSRLDWFGESRRYDAYFSGLEVVAPGT